MTTDIEEVREKIVIFENYLSDKAVEILKYMLLESDELEFNHDDLESFRLIDQDTFLLRTTSGQEYTLGFVRPVYDRIVSVNKGIFTLFGHILVIDSYQDGKFVINDPNSMKKSQKTWTYDEIKDQIAHIWLIN